ncbi:MAG: DUF2244 domain-containing protein [Gammaproteobacteria bacterium]|nr:DUF2244 domain-containing protein [Gammaproteobacteria bacterium]
MIEPNRQLSWKTTKRVFLALALCLGGVAWYFTSLGAWLVIPFTGLELLLIGLGLYLHCCHSHQQQVIQIDAESVSICDGRLGAQQASFPRAWAKIIQTRDPKGWYPSRLFIGSHGQFVEIGKFLIEGERDTLADNLRCAIQGA